jgi:hypothetical protein
MTRQLYEPYPTECPKDLPRHFYDSLKLYLEQGCQPGGFLMAVLRNDLVDAVGRADAEAEAHLRRILQFVYCSIPSPCWGSREKVEKWILGEYKNYEAA